MSEPRAVRAGSTIDLSTCDREPIHIPGSIQPNGVLLTLDESGTVLQVSANLEEIFGMPVKAMLGHPVAKLVRPEVMNDLLGRAGRGEISSQPISLGMLHIGLQSFVALAHRHDGVLFLELEIVEDSQPVRLDDLHPFVGRLQGEHTRDDMARAAADEVRRITGFDRVLVYQFDADWNGTVIAESRNEVLPSYLDLRFPASDIPAQARDLYRKNRLRLIQDVDYTPSAIMPAENPKTAKPIDLSYATLRSVSPVHREYMRNMETAASMSVSILRDGQLWGLLSCHNRAPLRVPFSVRTACDFIGQILALQLESYERNTEGSERIRLKRIESRLLARMAEHDDFVEALAEMSGDLLEFADASGAAAVVKNHVKCVGQCLSEQDTLKLTEWLGNEVNEDVFATENLSAVYPPAKEFAAVASGLLAIRVSMVRGTYVLWFRPEVVQTVRWGGDPTKPVESTDRGPQLHPRKSFEAWKETVRSRSRGWSRAVVESAGDLRTSIVGVVLRKAEELAELSSELERSNKELETFSYSVSHDLRAPFRHIVGFSELLKNKENEHLTTEGQRYIESIIDSARYAGKLVDHLLELSRITRKPMQTVPVKLQALANEVIREMKPETEGRKVEWTVSETLPDVDGDPVMLRLVMRNLISNALKYTRHEAVANIEVGCAREFGDYTIWVRDNGVGFDMRYANKLFGVFQRLHRQEEYEGTGIGLANVRRIIGRHHGRTWAEGELGKGATFYFSLPAPQQA